jgi:hypothetical protein
MKRPAFALLTLSLLSHAVDVSASDGFSLKGTVWEEASQKTCQVDPLLLYALALVESKSYAGQQVSPNPFALNISDVGHHPSTKAEATILLNKGLEQTRAIAVGAMQVSIRWNGSRVKHPTDLLDLRRNVFVGSQILCEMIAGQDDLALAIGRYHTPNPALEHIARHYGYNVLKVWRRLILLSEAHG